MPRLFLVTTLALAALALPSFASGHAPSRKTVPCGTPIEGWLVCYPPGSQATAQSRLVVSPIDPDAIVGRTTGLHLSQLRLYGGQGRRPNRGANLLYGFGKVCWKSVPCHTRYLVVGEGLGSRGLSIKPHISHPKLRHNGHVMHGPWTFVGSAPHRNLVITVYGTVAKNTIRRIGTRLL